MPTEELVRRIEFIGSLESDTFQDHTDNIPELSSVLAAQIKEDYPEMGISDEFVEAIRLASLVHDIGKLEIPYSILMKPGKLSSDEYEIIKQHPKIGLRILNRETRRLVKNEDDRRLLRLCRDIILWHHERMDGSGYPNQLLGDEIPLCAQILAIIDSFDAMTTPRVYKKSKTVEEATDELMSQTDKYNMLLLRSFKKVVQKIYA